MMGSIPPFHQFTFVACTVQGQPTLYTCLLLLNSQPFYNAVVSEKFWALQEHEVKCSAGTRSFVPEERDKAFPC